MNLQQFNKRMQFRAKNLPYAVNKVVKLVALAIDQTVVLATPVDTGRARSNWLVSLDTPTIGDREPYFPTKLGGLGERANAQAAINHGQLQIKRRKPGQTIYINNSVHYINKLNAGWSRQAPAQFVQNAVYAGIYAIKGAVIDTRKK